MFLKRALLILCSLSCLESNFGWGFCPIGVTQTFNVAQSKATALGALPDQQEPQPQQWGTTNTHDNDDDDVDSVFGRRDALRKSVLLAASFGAALSSGPSTAHAAGKALSEEYRQGTAALGDIDDNGPLPREAYKKLDGGLVYANMRVGGGKEAVEGSKCNVQWVLRKSNGYFVDSSQVSDSVPFIFAIGDGTAIKGVNDGMLGMKEGGTRRLIIPVNMAFVDGVEDGKPGPLPVGFGPRQQMRRVMGVRKDVPGEYIYLEVQLTKVR
jgi:FKBP-type peptidyl-prolyl cis-trans isomerase